MKQSLEYCINALSQKNTNSFQVDPFGLDPKSIKPLFNMAQWLYRNYFRCETFGAEHIPSDRVLVIANHSGQLPFDAMMIGMACMLETKQPRLLRGMAERWSAELPFVSTWFARGGTIVGEPKSCEILLEREEAVLVFPEGVKGISKLFKNRYQLVDFGHGFMRLALKTKTPILPVALVGAEEQAPSIANLEFLGKLLGTPGFPLIMPQIFPVPMPVKYRIHIGKPMFFSGDSTEDDETIAQHVHKVQSKIQSMLNQGLRRRKSIFF